MTFSEDSTGFILTRHQRESAGTIILEYWLVTTDGPVKLMSPPQKALFFVRQCDQPRIEYHLNAENIAYEYKHLQLIDFHHAAIAALYFSKTREAYKAKECLVAANIICYEDDIRLTDRFLMERFVYGSAHFTGTAKKPQLQNTQTALTPKHSFQCFNDIRLKPAKNSPTFKILSLDIECSERGELYSIGLAANDYHCVLMIGDPQESPNWITWVPDEKALLKHFIRVVEAYDPDLFIGWNVINFDFRLLIKRFQHYSIPLTLGRENELVSWRDRRNESNQGYVSMPGRLVIDGIDALKTATYHFESFSLEFVAQTLLGKGKKTDDVDNRMEAIRHNFHHNKIKLAEYNLQDCQLVLDIFSHTKLISFLTLRSQLTGLELDKMGGSVAAFLNVYLPKLHRAGYVAPNRPKNGGLASPGGYVMNSKPGLYTHVLVLDFKSLYPSLIRTFKIDPVGLVEGLKNPEEAIPGYKGALFSRQHHFLPDIITSLWRQRDEAKKDKDAARSQAIKILMNSFYGVLGSGGCPFYDTRLASSITMRGHEIMKTTTEWIEAEGYRVIYGDTDSIFIWLDGLISDEEAFSVGKRLEHSINHRWQDVITWTYGVECALEIEFETHYKRFLMPTIRGSAVGSKKRYAGLKTSKGGDELIFKGLETVRSDWTPLAKTFQHTLYSMVFNDEDVTDYLRQFIIDTRAGHYDHQLTYRKRLRRPLHTYAKNGPPHVKAARLADRINQSKGKKLRYQHKGTIAYIITTNGPEPVEYQSSLIDYEHYIEKQVRPIAEAILPFTDTSYDDIVGSQLSLF